MTSFIVTAADTVADDVVDAAKKVYSEVKGFVVNDVEPPLTNLVDKIIPDAVQTAIPFVEQAAADTATDLPLLLTGSWEAFAAAVGPLLIAVGVKAAAAEVQVAKTDALQAITVVASNTQAAASSTASTAPATVTVQ